MRRYSSNITDPLRRNMMDSFKKMSDDFGIDNDVKVSMLARCPEVLTMEEVPEDEEHMWELLKDALLKACEGLWSPGSVRERI